MNLSWSTNDPAVLDAARGFLSSVDAAPFSGKWAIVELRPDLFCPQKLGIGVLVAPPSPGRLAFRLITDTSKLQCIYGRKLAANLEDFVRSAEYTLSRAALSSAAIEDIEFGTDNLSVSDEWPTSGLSQDAVLSRLFNETIPLEPSEDKEESRFISLDTQQVRRLVGDELKRIAGLAFEQIVVDSRHARIVDELAVAHQLDFNLRISNGAGSVVSAVFKTPATVELNLLRADRDLRTYGGIKHLENLAVFVMIPKPGVLDAPDFIRVSELVDETVWRMERGGLKVSAFDEPEPIAREILEWAGLKG